jgi:hypothetical protein
MVYRYLLNLTFLPICFREGEGGIMKAASRNAARHVSTIGNKGFRMILIQSHVFLVNRFLSV